MRVSLRGKILREMIGNLLIHREFSSARYARLIIERDRMYTENANRAFRYGRITPKNLEPEPKNPIIANFFHQVRLADELGSGVRNLYHYVKIYSNAEPVFDEDDVFRLIVPLNDEYSADRAIVGELPQTKATQETVEKTVVESGAENSVGLGEKLGEKLGERRLKIVELVSTNAKVSISELADKVGISQTAIENNLRWLKMQGIIRRVGPDKGGHWEVIG